MKVNEIILEANADRDAEKLSREYDKRAKKAAKVFAGSLAREIHDALTAEKERGGQRLSPDDINDILDRKFTAATRMPADSEAVDMVLGQLSDVIYAKQKDILSSSNISQVRHYSEQALRIALSHRGRAERTRDEYGKEGYAEIARIPNAKAHEVGATHLVKVKGKWYLMKPFENGDAPGRYSLARTQLQEIPPETISSYGGGSVTKVRAKIDDRNNSIHVLGAAF